MVAPPDAYPWSSYAAHARGTPDALAAEHPLYRALGLAPAERQHAYRALFDAPLEPEFVESVRAATNGGWALGDERFKRQIAQALGRRVEKLPPGRPQKETDDKRQIKLL